MKKQKSEKEKVVGTLKYSKKEKGRQGITLIALVVTIVVLLILAGVSIVVLFGEHGIITVANQAANDHKLAFYMDKFEVVKTSVATQNAGKVPIEKFKDALINEKVVTAEQITGNNTDGYIATPEEDVKITMKQAEDGKNVTIKYELTNENGTTGGGSGEGSGEGGGDNPGGEGTNPDDPYQGADKESNWNLLGEIAKAIAQDPEINSDSIRATGITESGKKYDISVGDEFVVYYSGDGEGLKKVRVMGFKHDDLVDQNVYGETCTKAGISFEFINNMTQSHAFNTVASSDGGWAAMELRRYLNGYTTTNAIQSSEIGGEGEKLGNSMIIKKVKKDYITKGGLEGKLSSTPSQDFIWLLSCGEIWSDVGGAKWGSQVTQCEGYQYKYYKGNTIDFTEENEKLIKTRSSDGMEVDWYLRSPAAFGQNFRGISAKGLGDRQTKPEYSSNYIFPGFCI